MQVIWAPTRRVRLLIYSLKPTACRLLPPTRRHTSTSTHHASRIMPVRAEGSQGGECCHGAHHAARKPVVHACGEP